MSEESPPLLITTLLWCLDLDRQQGNALLVGVGGSGKKSLSKLGAFASGCRVFEVVLTRGYNEEAFREDLKILYGILGVENKPVVFLFTDAHVVDEGFLELINNMLTSGMVPALFKEEEKDGMISQVRDAVVASGMVDTKENCWQYFINRCRSNLHITLAMSPVGDTLRTRCRNFPGMVSSAHAPPLCFALLCSALGSNTNTI